MASKVLFAFFLCLLCMACALPVTRDLETSAIGLQSDGVLKIKPVLSSDKVLIRHTRQVIRGKGCARGRIYYKRRCMTKRRYEKMMQQDYEK